jgi:hypothetical protein
MSDVNVEQDADGLSKIRAALNKEREDVKALKASLNKARDQNNALMGQLNEVAVTKDPTTEKVKTYLDAAVQSQLAVATKAQLTRINALEAELAAAKTTADEVTGKLATRAVEQEIRDACAKQHVMPTAINDVLTLAKLELKHDPETGLVQTLDGRSALELVDDMKATSPHYWQPARGSGYLAHLKDPKGGGRGSMGDIGANAFGPGVGGNIFDPAASAWNLTAQGEMLKSNPALAAELKAKANQK